MESLYNVLAILTAGVSLTTGISSFLTYRKGREKLHLAFAILCFLVVIFTLLPPVGFIVADDVPYSTSIKIKRIFNLSFLAFLPWFIALYTGIDKRKLQSIITVSIIACYLVMFFATTENERKLWALVATVILATVLIQAFYSAYRQFKNGEIIKAIWLFGAMGIFACLNILGAVNHLSNNHFTAEWDAIFFPINLCPLAFVLIMGFQLQATPKQKSQLEKILGLRENQWQSLLDNIHLVVIHTDLEDRISYINPFGVSLLKYKDAAELIHTQWSDHCLPDNIIKTNNGSEKTTDPNATVKRSAFLTKDGKQKIINWTSDVRYDEENQVVGRTFVGSDITEQQLAANQIQELKAELEKENLESKEESPLIMHPDIVGKSRPFMYAIQKSKQVALTNASVLLLGETGVGKECFADLIQRTSLRASKPFIKVNCGALPAELIEDELFGHEKGAFTGAIQSRMGRFEKADGGTIFLDEIGELPLVLQPKLLRVLQNGEFERVGGHQTIKVDVRVIAATNNDLDKEVRENRFRDDLFYRLNVFPITIPPLRKRTADILLLIQTFIERASKEHAKHFDNISKADMNRLCDYEWPGNIRELKNVIERAVISSENNTLKLDWFYEDIEKNGQSLATASLEEMETAYIVKVLQECSWKINGDNGAAQKLVMHPNTLRSRMKKLKINVPWKQE